MAIPAVPSPKRTRRTGAWILLLPALLAAFPIVGAQTGPNRLGNLVYSWQQSYRQRVLLRPFQGLATLESDHFVLHYDEAADGRWARPVLEAAEASREMALTSLGWSPLAVSEEEARLAEGGTLEGKPHLLLYPDYDSLNEQFGRGGGFQALGAYWGGVIQVLTPRYWLADAPQMDAVHLLVTRGPFVHEYTHYLLDRTIPGGNYPRWLSEGLAQYVEYRETGYLWLEADNQISRPVSLEALYGLEDLEDHFDALENTSLAYREAFLLVAFLDDAYGSARTNLLVKGLADGLSFSTALRQAVGLTQADFEGRWLAWLDLNLARYSAVPDPGTQAVSFAPCGARALPGEEGTPG